MSPSRKFNEHRRRHSSRLPGWIDGDDRFFRDAPRPTARSRFNARIMKFFCSSIPTIFALVFLHLLRPSPSTLSCTPISFVLLFSPLHGPRSTYLNSIYHFSCSPSSIYLCSTPIFLFHLPLDRVVYTNACCAHAERVNRQAFRGWNRLEYSDPSECQEGKGWRARWTLHDEVLEEPRERHRLPLFSVSFFNESVTCFLN